MIYTTELIQNLRQVRSAANKLAKEDLLKSPEQFNAEIEAIKYLLNEVQVLASFNEALTTLL